MKITQSLVHYSLVPVQMQVELTQPRPALDAQSLLHVSLNVLSNELVVVARLVVLEATAVVVAETVALVELEMFELGFVSVNPNATKYQKI